MPETRSQKAAQVKTAIKLETKFVVKSEIKVETIKTEIKEEIDSKFIRKVKIEPIVKKPEKQFDDDGKPFWVLGRSRRLYVSSFKGKKYVHIRSFYTDGSTGMELPSKTGITMTKEEWKNLLAVQHDVNFNE